MQFVGLGILLRLSGESPLYLLCNYKIFKQRVYLPQLLIPNYLLLCATHYLHSSDIEVGIVPIMVSMIMSVVVHMAWAQLVQRYNYGA